MTRGPYLQQPNRLFTLVFDWHGGPASLDEISGDVDSAHDVFLRALGEDSNSSKLVGVGPPLMIQGIQSTSGMHFPGREFVRVLATSTKISRAVDGAAIFPGRSARLMRPGISAAVGIRIGFNGFIFRFL